MFNSDGFFKVSVNAHGIFQDMFFYSFRLWSFDASVVLFWKATYGKAMNGLCSRCGVLYDIAFQSDAKVNDGEPPIKQQCVYGSKAKSG